MEAELRKEPTANEGTCNSYEEVADDPEPGALHNLASQPSGNEADHQYDQETFTRHVHLRILQVFGRLDKIPAVFRERESHRLGRKRTLPVRRGGTTLLRHRGYHHSNRKDCAELLNSRGLQIYPHAFVVAKREHLNLVCPQSLQRILPGLTRLFPRAETVAGIPPLEERHVHEDSQVPGSGAGAPVFYFNSKTVCWS